MVRLVCAQLLQPGEAPLHAVRNMTLNGDVEVRYGGHSGYLTGNVLKRLLSYKIEISLDVAFCID